MALHNELGKFGEEKAAELLLSEGYIIKNQNYRFGRGELDIVAESDDFLVVVEVKTRKLGCYVSPMDKINQAKVRNIVYATQAYINRYRITKEVRFDIVVVIVDMEKGRVCKIDWLKDAFLPPVNM